jgi:zinc protease
MTTAARLAAGHRTGNGAVIISKKHTVPAVTIQVSLNAGSIYEADDQLGLSYLTSRTPDRGTARKSSDDIAEALDARGVSESQREPPCDDRELHLPAEHFEQMVELMGELVIEPEFPEGEIARRKVELPNAIRQDEDNPAAQAVQAMSRCSIRTASARPSGQGPDRHGQPADRAALNPFWLRFAPSSSPPSLSAMWTAAGGGGDSVFGGWQAPAQEEMPLATARGASRRERHPDDEQGAGRHRMGLPPSQRPSTTRTLMNNAPGIWIGGRLGDNIREKQGMAYHVFSSFDANVVEGPLVVRAA